MKRRRTRGLVAKLSPHRLIAEEVRAQGRENRGLQEASHLAQRRRDKPSAHPVLLPEHETESLEACPAGMAVIYALVDPRDGTVRYIGKTVQPAWRLATHVHRTHENKRLRRWIRELRKARAVPDMHAIDMVAVAEWEAAERRWIAFYRARGVLYNIEAGGASRRSEGQPTAPGRNAGTEREGSEGPRAADTGRAPPATGEYPPDRPKGGAATKPPTSQGSNAHQPSRGKRRSTGTPDGGEPRHEQHSRQNGADPTRDHREPEAGQTEGPHVRRAGVTSSSGPSLDGARRLVPLGGGAFRRTNGDPL